MDGPIFKINFTFNDDRESLSKIGIYRIFCKTTKKSYVGLTKSSKGFLARFYAHRSSLRNNQHYATYLQRCYNKYGEDDFLFEVLEFCDINENLAFREHCWMVKLDSIKNGYNFVAYEESENQLKVILNIKEGDPFKFKLSDGTVVEGSNLSEFCRKNNLNNYAMGRVSRGEILCHAGYFTTSPNFRERPAQRFLSIDNIITYTQNVVQFCKEHSLSRSGFVMMLIGRSAHYQGWHLESITPKQEKILSIYRSDISRGVNIINKNGDQFGRKLAFIQQIDQYTGEVLQIYDSVSHAIKNIFPNLSLEEHEQKCQRIRNVLRTSNKTAYKYVWRQGKDINDFERVDVTLYPKNKRGPLLFETPNSLLL